MIKLLIISILLIAVFILIRKGFFNQISRYINYDMRQRSKTLKKSMNETALDKRKKYIVLGTLLLVILMTTAIYLQTGVVIKNDYKKVDTELTTDSINNIIDNHF